MVYLRLQNPAGINTCIHESIQPLGQSENIFIIANI